MAAVSRKFALPPSAAGACPPSPSPPPGRRRRLGAKRKSLLPAANCHTNPWTWLCRARPCTLQWPQHSPRAQPRQSPAALFPLYSFPPALTSFPPASPGNITPPGPSSSAVVYARARPAPPAALAHLPSRRQKGAHAPARGSHAHGQRRLSPAPAPATRAGRQWLPPRG